MAPRGQLIEFPLATTLDTESDPKVAKGLLTVKNGEILKTGLIQKRRAFKPLSRTLLVGSTAQGAIESAYGLVGHKDALVLQGYRNRTHGTEARAAEAFLYSALGWRARLRSAVDPLPNATYTLHRAAMASSGAEVAGQASVVEGGGWRLYLYEINGRSFVTITDANSGALLRTEDLGVGTHNPRGFYVRYGTSTAKRFIVYSAAQPNLKYWLWDPASPQTVGTTGNHSTAMNANELWDACLSWRGTILIAFQNNVTNRITLSETTSDAAVLNTMPFATGTPTRVLTVFYVDFPRSGTGLAPTVVVAYQGNGTTDLQQNTVLSSDWTTQTHSTALGADVAVGSNMNQLSGVQTRTNTTVAAAGADGRGLVRGNGYIIIWEIDSTPYIHITSWWTFGNDGIPVAASNSAIRNAALVGRAFNYRGAPYWLVGVDTTLQSTYFLVTTRGDTDTTEYPVVAAKLLAGRAGGERARAGLSDVVEDHETGRFLYAGTRQDRFSTGGVAVESAVGLEILLDAPWAAVSLGKGAQLGGGVVREFDGGLQELGFHIFPESFTLTAIVSGAGIGAGTYSYKLVHEWVDRNGQIHRSAPSPASSTTIIAARDVTVTLIAPSIADSVSYRDLDKNNVSAGMTPLRTIAYRTTNGGTTYYQTASASAGGTITDTTTDANLIANPPLYTTGGELEVTGPRAGAIMAADDRRLYIVPFDDPYAVDFTKPKTEAYAPEFNDALTVRIDADGPNTGLAVMDGNRIVFKQKAIYIFGGDGPNAQGLGEFFPPRKLSTTDGCIDWRSVVTFQGGVIFRSASGYKLLDRSLTVVPIGDPVDSFKQYEVAASLVVHALEQIWFALKRTKTVLVFDYAHKVWLTHELEKACVGLADANGKVYFAAPDGTVFYRDESHVTEGTFALGSAWLKPQLQGYQRVNWGHLLGDLDGAFKVTLEYDYNDKVIAQTIKFAAKKGRKMVRFKPKVRKCTALRVSIEQTGDLRHNLAFNALSLVATSKGRAARLAPAETK
jgi:hypothetical protein